MEIQFLNGVKSTTGSMFKVSFENKKILLDCGIIEGNRDVSDKLNKNFPFKPEDIHSVILSHAHLDHCGRIPLLVKEGFNGSIFCTGATLDLTGAVLRNSAHNFEKDAEFINQLEPFENKKVEPLYCLADAELSLYHFQGIGFRRTFHVLRDVSCTFYNAGHILGSAISVLELKNPMGVKGTTKILYTGDMGRKYQPMLMSPEIVRDIDYIIVESTFGDTKKFNINEEKEKLINIINKTIRNGGKVIIPAFSIDRIQELLCYINDYLSTSEYSGTPIFIDSALSVNITEMLRHHSECYDDKTRFKLLNDEDPFGFESLNYIRSVEKSKMLNSYEKPCIIISSSATCESGRILHHLKHNISNEKNAIIFTNYMAEGTLGNKLVEGKKDVEIFGENYRVNAEIHQLYGFSAHPDSGDIMDYIEFCNTGVERTIKKIFVVHGGEKQSTELAEKIKKYLHIESVVPDQGESFEL